MTEYIKKEDVLKIIYDIKENKDIPKNYGTLLDIIQLVRNIPSEKVISESMGKCELAIAQNNNLYTDCNYCIELAKVEAYKEFAERLKPYEEKACCWCKHSDKGRRSLKCDEIIDDTGVCVKLWCVGWQKFESNIDHIKKEMVGEQ